MMKLMVFLFLSVMHASLAEYAFTEISDETELAEASRLVSTSNYPEKEILAESDKVVEANVAKYLGAIGQQIIPNPIKASRVCSVTHATYKLPTQVIYNGTVCWTFKPWWPVDFVYVKNCGGNCNVHNPCTKYERYTCVKANYIRHYYYIYCPQLTPRIRTRSLYLPQCCNCLKRVALFWKQ